MEILKFSRESVNRNTFSFETYSHVQRSEITLVREFICNYYHLIDIKVLIVYKPINICHPLPNII